MIKAGRLAKKIGWPKEVNEMIASVNLVALLAAALASMGIGFLWYSSFLFGKPWMKLVGYTPAEYQAAQKEMGTGYLLSLIATIVMVFVLAQVFHWVTPDTWEKIGRAHV